MTIRIALTAFLCWLFAFGWMTWGQIRLLHAQRYAESAALEYASARLREKKAELTQLNRELDFHMKVLRSSYPGIFKTGKAGQPSNGPASHQHDTSEVAQVGLRSSHDLPKPVADLVQPTP